MKKNIIALAIASAVAAPVVMADAPTVYGLLNLNLAMVEDQGNTINSTASRLGVKGSEDLGNGLKAVYQVEFGLDAVADSKTTTGATQAPLSQRNSFLGLAGNFGTVLMGRHDTPLKMSQANDLFNDGAADLANKNMVGGFATGEDRVDDVLAYVSPSFGGVTLVAASVMTEDKDDTDPLSIAAMYGSTKEGLFVSAAMTSAEDTTLMRASAQYIVSGLTANVIYMSADGDALADTKKGSVIQSNIGYKIGAFMPKIKVSVASPDAGDSSTNTAIGVNYSLGKKTTAYVYTVMTDKDKTGGANATFVGMLHKF
jgi:predicted porin